MAVGGEKSVLILYLVVVELARLLLFNWCRWWDLWVAPTTGEDADVDDDDGDDDIWFEDSGD